MTRNRKSAKAAGARTERLVADYLRAAMDNEFIDRKARTGSRDTGDVGGVRAHSQRVVVEVKDCARLDLPGWLREAETEAVNDAALCGVVVAKRRGVADPSKQFVVMELGHLVALITGERGHWAGEPE